MNGERVCLSCGCILVKKPGPGRWPVWCDGCRKAARLSAGRQRRPLVSQERLSEQRREAAKASWVGLTPEQRTERATRSAKAQWARYYETHDQPELKATRPPTPCLYCGVDLPQRNASLRAQCGAAECTRKYNAERTLKASRETKAKTGIWPSRKPVERICAICAKSWMADGGDTTKCCSRECTNVMRYGGRALTPPPGRHSIPAAVRRSVYDRDDWTCYLCGYPVDRTAVAPELEAPTIDHVVPVRSGGGNEVENLRTAHYYCNCVKGAKPLAMVA